MEQQHQNLENAAWDYITAREQLDDVVQRTASRNEMLINALLILVVLGFMAMVLWYSGVFGKSPIAAMEEEEETPQ